MVRWVYMTRNGRRYWGIDTIPFQKNCMWPLSSMILVPQRREGSFLKLQNYSIHCLSASRLQSEAAFFLGLWGGKQFGWDDPLPPEILSSWRELAKDLSGLSVIHFNRKGLVSGQPGDLYIFCDASKETYGFAAYVVQDRRSCLLFAKVKVRPNERKNSTCIRANGSLSCTKMSANHLE